MSPDKMIRMANQIATFFRTKPEQEAVEGIAKHINDFWDPRMRRQLLAWIADGKEGLDPLVLAAAPSIRRPASETA